MQRKCPSCGWATFTNEYRCSNCGTVLPSIQAGSAAQPHSSASGNMPKPSKPTNPSGTIHSPTQKNPPPPIPRQTILHKQPPVLTASPTSSPAVAPKPMPQLASVRKTSPIHAPHHPLPQKFYRWGPSLVEGKVLDIRQTQNVDRGFKTGDLLSIGAKTVLFFIDIKYLFMSWALGSKKSKDMKTIEILRIESPARGVVDVRIEKDMVGAGINICDYVSVWGREITGVVVMNRGFNHTVNAEIRLR